MSKQLPPASTVSAVGPCPTVIQIVGRPGTGSLPSTIAPPDHPLFKWELWKTRNKIKYENQRYTVVNITENTVRKILEATSFIEKTNIPKHYKNVISLLKRLE